MRLVITIIALNLMLVPYEACIAEPVTVPECQKFASEQGISSAICIRYISDNIPKVVRFLSSKDSFSNLRFTRLYREFEHSNFCPERQVSGPGRGYYGAQTVQECRTKECNASISIILSTSFEQPEASLLPQDFPGCQIPDIQLAVFSHFCLYYLFNSDGESRMDVAVERNEGLRKSAVLPLRLISYCESLEPWEIDILRKM